MNDAVNIFEDSFSRALVNHGYNKEFIERFYDLFIARSEKIADLFKDTNMAAQKTMLHDSLNYMLEYYRHPDNDVHLKHIKNVHGNTGLNIPADFYDLWLDCLIEALKNHDPEFNDKVEQAWRTILAPGIQYMRE